MISYLVSTATHEVASHHHGNKSNSQIVEKLPIGLLKAPHMRVKPPSQKAIAVCSTNMKRYGQPRPIIVDDNNNIIEGHEFLLAARELGWTHMNVVRLSGLSALDVKVLSLWLAKLPELSNWSNDELRIYFKEITIYDPDLIDLTGFSMAEIDVILDPTAKQEHENPLDDLSDVEHITEPVCRAGDLFILGGHKVLCDDSQRQENFEHLMGNNKAQAVVTDPPYNIKIKNNVSGLGKAKHDDFAMGVGEMSFETFLKFLHVMFSLCCNHLIAGGLIYVFMDRRHLEELFAAARKTFLKILDLAFWDKGSGGMGGLYRSQHEPCGVFKFGDDPHINNVRLGAHGRNRTNVWQQPGLASFSKGRLEDLAAHPTVKPVNLLAEIIKDSTKRGDIILDPFLGAGSTVLAAEKTGRRCFGIELEPKYVEVAIGRWQKMTSAQAIHEETGLTLEALRTLRQTPVSTIALPSPEQAAGGSNEQW